MWIGLTSRSILPGTRSIRPITVSIRRTFRCICPASRSISPTSSSVLQTTWSIRPTSRHLGQFIWAVWILELPGILNVCYAIRCFLKRQTRKAEHWHWKGMWTALSISTELTELRLSILIFLFWQRVLQTTSLTASLDHWTTWSTHRMQLRYSIFPLPHP